MKAEDIESFLTEKLISEISNFGDGTTDFHTRDLAKILEIINCKNDALTQNQNDIDELVESLAESNKQNFQLLQDKVKLEGEIINLKSRLSKYEKNNNC